MSGARLFTALALSTGAWASASAGASASASAGASTRPEACQRLTLRATIESSLARVRGSVQCVVGRDATLAVAAYPRALGAPEAVDTIERPWLYPAGASAADMSIAVAGAPLSGTGVWQSLGPRRAGELVEIDFATTIPERNGLFGRRGRASYLLAGWHPALGREGEPLAPQIIDYEITLPAATVGFVGVRPVGLTSPRVQRGRFAGLFLPVALGPAAIVDVTPHAVVMQLEDGPRSARAAQWRAAPAALRDVSTARDADVRAEIAKTLADGARYAEAHGITPRPLIVVVAPLREHAVEGFTGGLAVADRAFHLPPLGWLGWLGVPADLLARFHRQAIWRAQLTAYLEPAAARRESALPAAVVADALACDWRDDLVATRYGNEKHAPDYLEPVAVIPEIDALIFAPQAPFADAYFDAIDERRPRRDGVHDFAHELPRGKLLYEKLVDEIGRERAHALALAYVEADAPYLSLVGQADAAVAERLRQWLGPQPILDYVIGASEADARHIRIEVAARGPDAARVREPVSVAVEDAEGKVWRKTRIGPGPIELDAPGPARRIEIDPDGRTVELWHPPGESPRFSNRTPPRWRFLLNNISGLIAVTNRKVSVAADFGLHRIHEQRYDLDFRAAYSPEAYRASGGASYGFGSEVTPLRLSQHVGFGITGSRLQAERGSPTPGFELGASTYYHYDTRVSPVSSFVGQGASARLGASLGVDSAGRSYRFIQGSLSAFRLLPLSFYQALLVRARLDGSFGEAPAQALPRLGSRYTAGRGFESDEERADRRAVLSLEYRHALSVDTRTDFAGLFILTGIEGALFGDAVYLPVSRPGCGQDTFADVGYGLRFLVDILNVSPSSLAIDVGVPVRKCPDRDRLPVTIYLAFVQSFLLF